MALLRLLRRQRLLLRHLDRDLRVPPCRPLVPDGSKVGGHAAREAFDEGPLRDAIGPWWREARAPEDTRPTTGTTAASPSSASPGSASPSGSSPSSSSSASSGAEGGVA